MKVKTRFLVIGLILGIIAISLIAYRLLSDRATSTQVITLGAILPLTGDLSNYGVDTSKALQLAVEQQNAKGTIGGTKLELKVEDSRGVAAQAVSSFNKLADVDGIVACVGPITSPELLSVAPIANQKRVPVISPSSTSVDITKAGDYVFRTINVDTIETEAFASYVKNDMRVTSLGILANRAAGTISYANSFENFFTALGGKVAIKEILPQSSSEYRSTIGKVLAEQVPAIYIAGVSNEIGELVRQIRSLDPQVILLSYQSAEDRLVAEIARDSINNLVFSSTTLPDQALGSAHAAFVHDFAKKFGRRPGIFAAESYDAANIAVNALRRCTSESRELTTCLKQTSGYNGASGEITFDENGDVHKPIAIYRYINGAPVFLDLSGGKR